MKYNKLHVTNITYHLNHNSNFSVYDQLIGCNEDYLKIKAEIYLNIVYFLPMI